MKVIIDDTQNTVTLISDSLYSDDLNEFMNNIYYSQSCYSYNLEGDKAEFEFDNRDLMNLIMESLINNLSQKIYVEVERKRRKKSILPYKKGEKISSNGLFTVIVRNNK